MRLANRPASAETGGRSLVGYGGVWNLKEAIGTGPLHPSAVINVDKKR